MLMADTYRSMKTTLDDFEIAMLDAYRVVFRRHSAVPRIWMPSFPMRNESGLLEICHQTPVDENAAIIQAVVDTNTKAMFGHLNIVCFGNCADVDLKPLAKIADLRSLKITIHLDKPTEPTCIDDSVIQAWTQGMHELNRLDMIYKSTTSKAVGNRPTLASLVALAEGCPRLKRLTIPIDAIMSDFATEAIKPFTRLTSLSCPSFVSFEEDLPQYCDVLASLCPTIVNFSVEENPWFSCYLHGFSRDPILCNTLRELFVTAFRRAAADVTLPRILRDLFQGLKDVPGATSCRD